jgi:type IV pilus assembly protein PilO
MNLNIDLAQLRNIDFNDVSRWPIPLKVAVIALVCAAVLGAGVWFDTRSQLEELEATRKKENTLKNEFLAKQNKAASLDAYVEQMEEMRRSFGTMLRQLPSRTEVAELLVDISQTGIENGLEFELFKPEAERPAEFYAELPIKIKVAGGYHEFGRFVSDIATLPRIVTLQDFSIGPMKQRGRGNNSTVPDQGALVMEITARTYRYLDEEELLDGGELQ